MSFLSNLFGGGSPSPPPAPDPTVTAGAQSQSNINTAIANAQLNRVNQTTPWGSINYTQGPAGPNGVPTWSSNIALDPQQQALLDTQRGQATQRNQLAGNYLNQVSGAPLDLSHLQPIYDRYGSNAQAPSAQAPSGQVPSGQVPSVQAPAGNAQSRDQMLQLLQQYMASQGQTPGAGANPAARMAQALRPSPSGMTNVAPQTSNVAPSNVAPSPSSPPLGTIGNALSQYTQAQDASFGDSSYKGTPTDPALQALIDSGRIDKSGNIIGADGQQYVQVGGVNQDGTGNSRVIDSKGVKYDPQLGYITPRSNYKLPNESFLDKNGFALATAAFGGPALGAAMGGTGGALGGVAATDAAESGGTLALNAAGTGVAPYVGSSAGVLAGSAGGAPMPEMAGPTAPAAGAPTAGMNGPTASQPNLLQQAYSNWSSGRGILGLHPAVSSGGPLLAQLLRRIGTQQAGGQK